MEMNENLNTSWTLDISWTQADMAAVLQAGMGGQLDQTNNIPAQSQDTSVTMETYDFLDEYAGEEWNEFKGPVADFFRQHAQPAPIFPTEAEADYLFPAADSLSPVDANPLPFPGQADSPTFPAQADDTFLAPVPVNFSGSATVPQQQSLPFWAQAPLTSSDWPIAPPQQDLSAHEANFSALTAASPSSSDPFLDAGYGLLEAFSRTLAPPLPPAADATAPRPQASGLTLPIQVPAQEARALAPSGTFVSVLTPLSPARPPGTALPASEPLPSRDTRAGSQDFSEPDSPVHTDPLFPSPASLTAGPLPPAPADDPGSVKVGGLTLPGRAIQRPAPTVIAAPAVPPAPAVPAVPAAPAAGKKRAAPDSADEDTATAGPSTNKRRAAKKTAAPGPTTEDTTTACPSNKNARPNRKGRACKVGACDACKKSKSGCQPMVPDNGRCKGCVIKGLVCLHSSSDGRTNLNMANAITGHATLVRMCAGAMVWRAYLVSRLSAAAEVGEDLLSGDAGINPDLARLEELLGLEGHSNVFSHQYECINQAAAMGWGQELTKADEMGKVVIAEDAANKALKALEDQAEKAPDGQTKKKKPKKSAVKLQNLRAQKALVIDTIAIEIARALFDFARNEAGIRGPQGYEMQPLRDIVEFAQKAHDYTVRHLEDARRCRATPMAAADPGSIPGLYRDMFQSVEPPQGQPQGAFSISAAYGDVIVS